MSQNKEFDTLTIAVFTGKANPHACAGDYAAPACTTGSRRCGPVQRRRSERRVDGKRPRARCVHRAVDESAGGEPHGVADDDGRLPARIGEAHHRGGAVLRLRAPGSPAARHARGHHGEAGGEHDCQRGRRSIADGGSACGSDSGFFRHSGRQCLCIAGAVGRCLEAEVQGHGGGFARRRRRGAREGAGQAIG